MNLQDVRQECLRLVLMHRQPGTAAAAIEEAQAFAEFILKRPEPGNQEQPAHDTGDTA